MNDINKSKLKETNYEAFKQIHIDDKEKSIEDYECISSNSTEIIDWQCPNNNQHIWSTQIYNRGTVENDLGCPYCLNQHLFKEGPVLILHKRNSNNKREYVYSIWNCSKCHSVWEIKDFDSLHYKSTCLICDIGIVFKPLEETHPHLAKEWDDESNLLTSNRVNIEYPFDITWKCSSCYQYG